MKDLLTHSFTKQDKWVSGENLKDISNPYDTSVEHRHSYFEVFFIEKSGSSKIVDFVEYPLFEDSCYIVFPRQIHLFKNARKTNGYVLQFREEAVVSSRLNTLLQNVSFDLNSPILFEKNAEKLTDVLEIFFLIRKFSENRSSLSHESVLHLLQVLLFQLIEMREVMADTDLSDNEDLFNRFRQLLEANFMENHQVQFYAKDLNTTVRKIAYATQSHLGKTPLQVIHNRIILEAKRLLLFGDMSNKEVSYKLGFDSPASFSHFIKNKTGYTPTALKTKIVKIHK